MCFLLPVQGALVWAGGWGQVADAEAHQGAKGAMTKKGGGPLTPPRPGVAWAGVGRGGLGVWSSSERWWPLHHRPPWEPPASRSLIDPSHPVECGRKIKALGSGGSSFRFRLYGFPAV